MLRAAILLVSMAGWIAPAAAESAGGVPQGRLDVQPWLFLRTHPSFQAVSATEFPGGILYPERADLEGMLVFSGPSDVVSAIADACRERANDPSALVEYFSVVVEQLDTSGAVDRSVEPGAIRLTATDEAFRWLFRIPIELGEVWQEGHYRLRMHPDAGGMPAAHPVYFEIRAARRHTGDEINFLTNAWLDTPAGIAEQLYEADASFRGTKPLERILELDPYDVFARVRLAQVELRLGCPSRAARLYREIHELWEADKAHRLEALVIKSGTRDPMPRPRSEAEWRKLVESELERVEASARDYRRAEAQAERTLAADPEQIEVLLASPEPWVALAAIRAAGRPGLASAEPALRAELARAPAQTQYEIIKALAKIHDSTLTITDDMSPREKADIVERWLQGVDCSTHWGSTESQRLKRRSTRKAWRVPVTRPRCDSDVLAVHTHSRSSVGDA